MTRSTTSILAMLSGMSLAVACVDTDDDKDDGDDITNVGDFSDGSGGGAGGGGAGDGGTGDGGADDGAGDDGGTGDVDVDVDGGHDDGDDDGGGGDGSGGSVPLPAFELPEVECEDGLHWQVIMVDSESGTCTTCAYGADHWVVAAVQNPCSEDLQIELYDGYLIGGMELVNTSTGDGEGFSVGSSGGVDLVVVPAGDFIFEPIALTRMTRGEYELDLRFNDSESHSAWLDFTIE